MSRERPEEQEGDDGHRAPEQDIKRIEKDPLVMPERRALFWMLCGSPAFTYRYDGWSGGKTNRFLYTREIPHYFFPFF